MALKFQSLIIIWWSSQKMVPVMAWNLPYFYLRGFPKKVAISGMESSPKNVPVMACFCPLFIFIWWLPQKKCDSYGMETYSLIFRGGPIHLFIFGVLPTTATTKNTPAHSSLFFQKITAALAPAAGVKKMPFLAG